MEAEKFIAKYPQYALGELFANYLIYIKKRKDIDNEDGYTMEDIRDFEVATLHVLNHIATNFKQEPLTEEEIKNQVVEMHQEKISCQ